MTLNSGFGFVSPEGTQTIRCERQVGPFTLSSVCIGTQNGVARCTAQLEAAAMGVGADALGGVDGFSKVPRGKPFWNRRIEALAVAPPLAEGEGHRITTFVSIMTANVAHPTDLSTNIVIRINDQIIKKIELHVGPELVTDPSTSASCIGGTRWTCYPPGSSDCGCETFHCENIIAALQPGDDLNVSLELPSGARADTNGCLDERCIRFNGEPFLAVAPLGIDPRSCVRILDTPGAQSGCEC